MSDLPKIILRAEAIRLGFKTYFTGKPCKHGHVSERWAISRGCLGCKLGPQKRQRVRNLERARESNRKWLAKNLEWLREHRRKIYAENPTPKREANRRWDIKNRDRFCVYAQNRRARVLGADGHHTADEIEELKIKQGFKCAGPSCGVSIKLKFHRDHIVPLDLGGSNWISNIQLLCPTCNLKKGAKHPIAWAQENGRLL